MRAKMRTIFPKSAHADGKKSTDESSTKKKKTENEEQKLN